MSAETYSFVGVVRSMALEFLGVERAFVAEWGEYPYNPRPRWRRWLSTREQRFEDARAAVEVELLVICGRIAALTMNRRDEVFNRLYSEDPEYVDQITEALCAYRLEGNE